MCQSVSSFRRFILVGNCRPRGVARDRSICRFQMLFMSDPVIATYLVETPHPVEVAAEMIAGEQSSGRLLPFRARPKSSKRAPVRG